MDAKYGYKTEYSNPDCENKDDKNCCVGNVNEFGLCAACYHRLRIVKADRFDKFFQLEYVQKKDIVPLIVLSAIGIFVSVGILIGLVYMIAKLIG